LEKPSIYLIPNLLGSEASIERSLPQENLAIINSLKHFAVENLKDTRRFLVRIGLKAKIDESEFFTLDKRSQIEDLDSILTVLKNGHSVGIITDAGCPGIADPGALLVDIAHQHNYKVVPLIGPSSILLAIMGSGFNGQSFAFNGYLERDSSKRIKEIRSLEAKMQSQKQTQLFMETPYRNNALLGDLLTYLNPNTKLCIAANISLPDEFIQTKSILNWKKNTPDLNKQPTIFLIGN